MSKRVFLSFVGLFLLNAIVIQAQETVLIHRNAVWKYHHNQTPPPNNWKDQFFREDWQSGPAKLGYGDANVVTPIGGSDLAERPVTAYFRHSFLVENPTFSKLVVRLLRDDGAVVYLNGAEVARSNMPAGE